MTDAERLRALADVLRACCGDDYHWSGWPRLLETGTSPVGCGCNEADVLDAIASRLEKREAFTKAAEDHFRIAELEEHTGEIDTKAWVNSHRAGLTAFRAMKEAERE